MSAPAPYSIVLVLKPFTHHAGKAHNNMDRFLKIGMVSYAKYLDTSTLKDFFVVVPAADVAVVQSMLTSAYPTFPWRVINEDTLLHATIPPGWARQQTVKLAVSMLVQTETYLIVDDDTYLTKPFSSSNMRDPSSGKLLLNKTKIDFPFFFLWSAQVLRADFEMVQDAPCHMAITPEIFVTSVVKDIVRWLVDNYGNQKKWQVFLAEHKYTEYCLYWIWLLQRNKASELYAIDSPLSLYGHATTGDEHDLSSQVQKSFEDNQNFWFSFVQTSLPHSVDQVEKTVRRFLN
jgi:hypothetical protein